MIRRKWALCALTAACVLPGCVHWTCPARMLRAEVVGYDDSTAIVMIDGQRLYVDLGADFVLAALRRSPPPEITGAWCVTSGARSFYIVEVNHEKYLRAGELAPC